MNQAPKTGKHPRGLMVLFFTEMWERFGYYLMVGILLLYLISDNGKDMPRAMGADIVGTFIALVYLTPFIGGLIADRYLGYIKSIFLGGPLPMSTSRRRSLMLLLPRTSGRAFAISSRSRWMNSVAPPHG